MSWDEVGDTLCPISRALAVMGDRWTVLIFREMSAGVHRFDDIQAQVGISSFLLSTRLKRLEADGLIERRSYSEKPPRFEYHPTAKGKAIDPIILALRAWGLEWGGYPEGSEPAVGMVHRRTGEVVDQMWAIPKEDMPFTLDCIDSTLSEAFAAEREEKRAKFYAQRRQPKKASA